MVKSRRSWHKSPYLGFITCVTTVNVVFTGKLIKFPSFWCASLRLSLSTGVFVYGCQIEVRHFGCFLVVKKAIHNFEYLFKILIVYKVEIRGDLQKEKRNMFLFPANGNCDIVSRCFILNVEFYFIWLKGGHTIFRLPRGLKDWAFF